MQTVSDIRKHFIGELMTEPSQQTKPVKMRSNYLALHFSQQNPQFSDSPAMNTLSEKLIGIFLALLTFGIFMVGTLFLLRHGSTLLTIMGT